MLRFTPIENARQAESYYAKSDGGYYLDGEELGREWLGKGAARLGLSGRPDYEAFKRLIHGLDPHTGEQLTAMLIDGRIPGWDVTASVPKGVTTALERGDARVQRVISWAKTKSFEDLEAMATTRVRKGGRQEDRVTGNLVGYAKEDAETRPVGEDGSKMPDWDRHWHLVIFNLTHDPVEDEWKAVKFRPIMDLRKWFSHRFDMYVARGMTELGYEIETKHRADGKGGRRYYSWDIKGIPGSVISKSSRRSLLDIAGAEKETLAALQEKVRKENEEQGKNDPIPEELSTRAKDKLGATSRENKRAELTLADCRAWWNARITPEEGKAIAETIRRAREGRNPKPQNSADKGVAFAIGHWFHRHSVLEQRFKHVTGLAITAMEKCLGGALPEDLNREFRKQGVLANDEALPAWNPRKEVTTQAKYQQERSISRFARDGRGTQRPVVTGRREVRELLRAREAGQVGITLTDQQESAIIGLAGSRNVVNVVDAGQGTGKTEMLAAFADILSGRHVEATWLGTTHTAVGELTARGLPTMTVAHFLDSPAEQKKAAGSRIIVDESSMLAQEDAYRLCLYAEAHGCRIDFVGDSKQYKSPVAGDTMRLLTSRFTGIVPITMTKTMRQQGRLKQAMEDIRDGKELQGHDTLRELGMVHELPLDQLPQKAAELYLQWTAKGDQVPVISPTHAQGDEIAARIRQGLRARGDLKGDEHTLRRLFRLDWSPPQIAEAREHGAEEGVVLTPYGAYLEQTQELAAGDLVRTTMGGKTKDGTHRLVNGTRYRIKDFTEAGDPVLNNGWVVDKDWGGLVQNYVSTGQGAQGRTAQRAIVVYGTPSLVATRREGFYVPVSRVRKEVAVLTDSNAALREAIQSQESRKLASELVEARERQRLSLRQRLGKHLATVRRLAGFAWMHQREPRQQQRTPSVQRRIEHGR